MYFLLLFLLSPSISFFILLFTFFCYLLHLSGILFMFPDVLNLAHPKT